MTDQSDPKAPRGPRFSRRAIGAGVVVSFGLLILVALCLFWFPHLLVHEGPLRDDPEALEKALSDARANLLTAVAGLAIIVTGFFTLWRIRIEEDQSETMRAQMVTQAEAARRSEELTRAQIDGQAEAARRSEELTVEGQITERYSRAIEQLGAQDNGDLSRLDVRVGGIFALERIAGDAEAQQSADANEPARDHATVVEVLSNFVLTHIADGRPTTAEAAPATWCPRRDVLAALRVLGRQGVPAKLGDLDAAGADLSGARLIGADLGRANLRWSNLRWSDLSRAYLSGANLSGANLRLANLSGARLIGADLSGANLRTSNLSGALYDTNTQWRVGFAPPEDAVNLDSAEAPNDDQGDGKQVGGENGK